MESKLEYIQATKALFQAINKATFFNIEGSEMEAITLAKNSLAKMCKEMGDELDEKAAKEALENKDSKDVKPPIKGKK